MVSYPKFSELPIVPDAPAHSAWGVFDRDGQRDTLGTLNFITKEAVVDARREIQTGESVVLNLPLHLPYNTSKINRIDFDHNIIYGAYGMACCDDEIRLNTQSSSQWDGLLHYAHQERREYYNGVSYCDSGETPEIRSLGIQAMCRRGGIVGRGILLDFVRYAAKRGINYDPLKNYAISLAEIKAMLEEENLDVRAGDIMLVRTGVSQWILNSNPSSERYPDTNTHIGVEFSLELMEWLWNHNIAAVGGDAMAFEVVPGVDGSFMKFHQMALAGWGMPIGELLDLEGLASLAENNQRWSFFLTVCPLNIEGGIATPANTLAIF